MDTKDLIDILVEQNGNFKDMLVFAVGSILTILVIFLTANFFTMRKIRADEIDKIQLEVIQKVKDNSLPKLQQDLNTKLESLVETKFSELEIKFSDIATKISNLETKISDQKSYLESRISNLETKLQANTTRDETNFKSTNRLLEGIESKFKKETFELKGLLFSLEADFWVHKEIYNNAFNYYLSSGNCFLESSKGRIDNILSRLEKTAEKLPFVQGNISEFNKFASKLDSEYQAQTTKIVEILKEKKQL
jgi:hypothetical protein